MTNIKIQETFLYKKKRLTWKYNFKMYIYYLVVEHEFLQKFQMIFHPNTVSLKVNNNNR